MARETFGASAQGIAAMAVWLAMLGGLYVTAIGAESAQPPGLRTASQEPVLPPGLQGSGSEPSLPSGLEPRGTDELPLPAGLGEQAPGAEELGTEAQPGAPLRIAGFWEARAGASLRESEHERRTSLGETRLQLDLEKAAAGVTFRLVADLVYDGLADTHAVELETGQGYLDLREANALFSPAASVDVKAGRQILTWGTGDLLFINDLFPKDFVAFFVGRDDAYLKAPSDALKVSGFSPWLKIDLVYTPRFDSDRFITGERVSFFDPAQGRIVGRDADLEAQYPRDGPADEWALRFYRNLAAYELALYGYDGFWKSPAGVDPVTGRATFPRLAVYGASLRGPLGPGIAHLEFGNYDSRDDPGGDDPLIRNSEQRVLVGYEQEAARNIILGLQYYLERMEDYDAYRQTLPSGVPPRNELQRVVTVRTTWLTLSQNLVWSLFAFYSPSDRDSYVRPKVSYQIDDNWSAELGGNLFHGEEQHTFFGQFEDNSNAYAGLRYGY